MDGVYTRPCSRFSDPVGGEQHTSVIVFGSGSEPHLPAVEGVVSVENPVLLEPYLLFLE